MRWFIGIGLAILLSACAGTSYWSWQHPAGLGEAERQQSEKTCDRIVQEETSPRSYYPPYFYGSYGHYPHHYGHPFAARHHYGYNHYGSAGYYGERIDAFSVCMRAKGWQQVEDRS